VATRQRGRYSLKVLIHRQRRDHERRDRGRLTAVVAIATAANVTTSNEAIGNATNASANRTFGHYQHSFFTLMSLNVQVSCRGRNPMSEMSNCIWV
jgi:hypothetical protein